MNIFERIWGFFENDWEIKYVVHAKWNTSVYEEGVYLYKVNYDCRYEFVYSKYFDKWKFECYGHEPKKHDMYAYLINNFDDYTKMILDPAQFKEFKEEKERLHKIKKYGK